MADLISLESKRKLKSYSNIETRSLNVLELMESIFGSVHINPVKVEPSIVNDNWPNFNIVSDVNFVVNSPLVLCSFYLV